MKRDDWLYREIKDIIEDESMAAPDASVESFLNKERAQSLLGWLDERERTIIEMRYGLSEDGEEHTLSEIAKKLNISRERVRQIQELTIKKLKKFLNEKESQEEEK